MTRIRSAVAAALAVVGLASAGGPAAAAPPAPPDPPATPAALALFANSSSLAQPLLVATINEDPDVSTVLQVGDAVNPCSDGRYSAARANLDRFTDPAIYTPGERDWATCSEPANGAFLPTERLARLRSALFPNPNVTLGGPRTVESEQSVAEHSPYVENRRWVDGGVLFSTLHVIGADNGLAPWYGGAETVSQRDAREAEFYARKAAAVTWLHRAFDRAEQLGKPCVAFAMHADIWKPGAGYEYLRNNLEGRAASFGRPVLVIIGDTDTFEATQPYSGAPGLTRLAVGHSETQWVKLVADASVPGCFSWRVMPLAPVPVVPEAPWVVAVSIVCLLICVLPVASGTRFAQSSRKLR